MIKINIKLYGFLRELKDDFSINLDSACNIKNLREVLITHDLPADILKQCAFADNKQLLNNDYVVDSDLELSILPPVCGG